MIPWQHLAGGTGDFIECRHTSPNWIQYKVTTIRTEFPPAFFPIAQERTHGHPMERRFPAVTTKLKPDFAGHRRHPRWLERLIANGVSGVVMMGMVGENAQLAPEES